MIKMDLKSYYKDKRVLVTGHTGFKGTWLSKILVEWGATVTGYALEPKETESFFALSGVSETMNSVIGDIRDLAHLKKVFDECKPEIVFHLAAQPLVRLSYSEPVYTYETNVMGTVNVLECIRCCDSVQSVVNVTTDKVYENKEWEWGYRENEGLCGFDPYSNSKSCSELVTYSYVNSYFNNNENLKVSTARSGNVIGGGDFSQDRIIPDCIRAAQKKESIIVRNPHSTRPYQHVLECLSGYLLLAAKQQAEPELKGAYNFAPNEDSCVTTGQLVDLFCETWGEGLSWKNQWDGGPHEANFLKLDISKAKKYLGWIPSCSISEAIQLTVEFTKQIESNKSVDLIMKEQIENYFNN